MNFKLYLFRGVGTVKFPVKQLKRIPDKFANLLNFLHFQPLISGEAAASPASPVPTPLTSAHLASPTCHGTGYFFVPSQSQGIFWVPVTKSQTSKFILYQKPAKALPESSAELRVRLVTTFVKCFYRHLQ